MGASCRILGALSVAGLLLVCNAHAKGPFGSIQVGHWNGGAYTSDTTGQFSHCAAGAGYVSGVTFIVSLGADGTWALGFIHNAWQLRLGESFPIDLTFDGRSQFHVFGTALMTNFVAVPMPTSSSLMAQFRKSATMSAFAKGQAFQFNLDSTSVLLPTLANCVASMRVHGVQNAGVFTARAAPKAEAPAAPVVGGSLEKDSGPAVSAELQIEAIELATNFILKTFLHSPKVLTRDETPIEVAATGAAWKSEEASGFVRIVPPQKDLKGVDVAAAVVGNDAKTCKGKFASARKSELVDSDVVFQGFASCEDSNGARFAQYFIVPRPKGGFVMFSVVSNMQTEQARSVTKEDKTSDFRKAALVVVESK